MTAHGPAPRPAVAGIVLAGGRASRFGRDKLAEPVDGRPLLHHAIRAVAAVADEVLLLVAPDGDASVADEDLGSVPVRVVRDPEPFGGPLVALSAALDVTPAPIGLLVGGDMPALQPSVLAEMVAALGPHDADVVLLEGRGPVQSMPAAIRTAAVRPAARAALAADARALRALYDRVRVVTLPLASWTRLDPAGLTLRDVDSPADLGG